MSAGVSIIIEMSSGQLAEFAHVPMKHIGRVFLYLAFRETMRTEDATAVTY
jgi:hypothetical protein